MLDVLYCYIATLLYEGHITPLTHVKGRCFARRAILLYEGRIASLTHVKERADAGRADATLNREGPCIKQNRTKPNRMDQDRTERNRTEKNGIESRSILIRPSPSCTKQN